MHKETSRLSSILYLAYFELLVCNVLHSASNMYSWTCLIAIPNKLNLLVANEPHESLIPYNIIRIAQKTESLNTVTPNPAPN